MQESSKRVGSRLCRRATVLVIVAFAACGSAVLRVPVRLISSLGIEPLAPHDDGCMLSSANELVTAVAATADRPRSRPTPRLPWQLVTGPDSSRQVLHGIEALLSVDEVARLLCISESGVYRLVRSGELPRVKVGKRTLFEPHAIRRFIASRRDATAETQGGQGSGAHDLEVVDG